MIKQVNWRPGLSYIITYPTIRVTPQTMIFRIIDRFVTVPVLTAGVSTSYKIQEVTTQVSSTLKSTSRNCTPSEGDGRRWWSVLGDPMLVVLRLLWQTANGSNVRKTKHLYRFDYQRMDFGWGHHGSVPYHYSYDKI